MSSKNFLLSFTVFSLLSIISSCATALEGLAARTIAGEALAAEGATLSLTRAGLSRAASVRVLAAAEATSLRVAARSLSAEGILVEDFGFSRVRVRPSKTPQLYYYESTGQQKYIADIVAENTLRWRATGETTVFKDAIFKISNRSVHVRAAGGTEYSILHTLAPSEPVLVLREIESWSQVLYSKGEIGWIKSALLIAVLTPDGDAPSSPNIVQKPVAACMTNNTGDIEFTNSLNHEIGIIACEVNTGGCGPGAYGSPILILRPQQTKAYYGLKGNVLYEFQIYEKYSENSDYRQNENLIIDGGEIMVDKCQTTKYVVGAKIHSAYATRYKYFTIVNSSAQDLYFLICNPDNGPCGLGNYTALLMMAKAGESKAVYSMNWEKTYDFMAFIDNEKSSWGSKRNWGKVYDQGQIRLDSQTNQYIIK